MALQQREKILAVVTGTLLLVVAGPLLLFRGGGTLGALRKSRDDKEAEVAKKEADFQRRSKAVARLAQWKKRSLPANPKIANSLYQNWLRELVARVKLRDAKVDPKAPQSGRGAYWNLRFSIDGQGTLQQLAQLLYEFYSADHLHKIRNLTIKPAAGSKEFDLSILVEALSLPGADRRDKLSTGKSNRLAKSSLDEYYRAIVRRKMEGDRFAESGGLFAAYVPAAPPPRVGNTGPRPPSFDPAEHTYVTAILELDGKPQVWLDVRTTGEKLRLYQGDPFEVGRLSGTIKSIEPRCITIETGGESRMIKLGNNLYQVARAGEQE